MNSKTPRWTAAPWRVCKDCEGSKVVCFDPFGSSALICGRNKEDNARLIAAAPELVEALRALVDWSDLHRDSLAYESGKQDIESARLLLAKLEGGQA